MYVSFNKSKNFIWFGTFTSLHQKYVFLLVTKARFFTALVYANVAYVILINIIVFDTKTVIFDFLPDCNLSNLFYFFIGSFVEADILFCVNLYTIVICECCNTVIVFVCEKRFTAFQLF